MAKKLFNRLRIVQLFAVVAALNLICFSSFWIYSLRPLPGLPELSGHVTGAADAEWARIPVEGQQCQLANNVWNKGSSGRGFRQEIFTEELGGGPALGWRWRAPWQIWPNVAAYPEIICGNKPWDKPVAAFPGLPLHPGQRRITADYNIRLQAVGAYELAFSMWAVSALPASPTTIRSEIMIWIASRHQKPAGSLRGTVTAQGVAYDIYVNEHQHDNSGANRNEWTYVAFVARQPVLNGPLEFSAFLDELQRRQIVTPSQWITDVELGTEVADGSGIAEIREFALRVEDRGWQGR